MSRAVGWEVDRVAGESRVEVYLEDGTVRVAYGSLLASRSFERLLMGRKPHEVPYIVARICGVCSQPHFWAATLAVEQITGVEASEDTSRLRDVCNKLSLIQNHLVHLGLLALPDYVDVGTAERVAREVLVLNSYVDRAVKLLCGRLTSPNSYSLGRFLTNFSPRILRLVGELLKSSSRYIEELTTKVLDIGLPTLRDPAPYYVALSGSPIVTVPRGPPYYIETPEEREQIDPLNYRKIFTESMVGYSTSKKCLHVGRAFYVGTRARLLAALRSGTVGDEDRYEILKYEKLLEGNPYANLLTKALEVKIVLKSLLHDLEELSSKELRLEPIELSKGEKMGLGIVEAPRGLLMHYYEVDSKMKIARADIITPTVMNTEHIELSATSLVREQLSNTSDETSIRVLVESLIRTYDPCIPCAVHLVKKR